MAAAVKVLIAFLALWILARAVQSGCAPGRVQEPSGNTAAGGMQAAFQSAVQTAVGSAMRNAPEGVKQMLGRLNVADEASTTLKSNFKLYGAEWCTFTRKQWAELTGKTWEESKGAYEADPQVVKCDKVGEDGGPAEGSVDAAICQKTGYPTVVDTLQKGFPTAAGEVDAYLTNGTPATGVYLGFDASNTATFKP